MRDKWNSRFLFILASVGSAVGLGNAWRFPGLCAKFGGGAFLIAYLICMIIVGIPLLMMEISIGRKMKAGAPLAMKGINKKAEFVGWAATSNAFGIVCYYAVVFAWCILMCFVSFRFATDHTTVETASNLWSESIGVTWSTSFLGDGSKISVLLFICLIIAWGFIYFSIRNGSSSVSKVVKYTVFLPIIMLIILAVKGFINNPYLNEAMYTLFVPKWSEFGNALLWVNAMGQVFYSLSIMMAIMFAYGSFLKDDSNIAEDAVIIAFSDLAISILSGIVLFTTMYEVGMTVNDMSASGIATAFIIYPTAIVNLSDIPWLNAVFGFVFYFMLCTLAIDSAFSIIEGVSTGVADRFNFNKKKTTLTISIISAIISIVFITGAGVGWLDIVDNWANSFNLILVGVLETIVVGWFFKPKKVLAEINKNTKKFRMPGWWFTASIKFIAPLSLLIFFIWQLVDIFVTKGGRYNTDYSLTAELIGGWIFTSLVFLSGPIIAVITLCSKKLRARKKFVDDNFLSWDEINDIKHFDTEVVAPIAVAPIEEAPINEVVQIVAPIEEVIEEKAPIKPTPQVKRFGSEAELNDYLDSLKVSDKKIIIRKK